MMKIAMSPAAAALLRALIGRAGVNRNRILLTEFRSTDWQSLTFVGERHEMRLRVQGPDAGEILHRLTAGLDEFEFDLPGHIVADIAVNNAPSADADGSVSVVIEALTIAAS